MLQKPLVRCTALLMTTEVPFCLLLLLLTACGPGFRRDEAPAPFKRNSIQAADIRAAGVVSAHEAVARLRPWFLGRRRGGEGAIVIVDGVRVHGTAVLEAIPAGDIVRIDYLSALEATARLGSRGHSGAILVQTGKPSTP
jgi:hypothetical protein